MEKESVGVGDNVQKNTAMTSYQKRKEDIRALLATIEILIGDDQYKAEEMKQRLQMERDTLRMIYFGSRQSEPPFRTGGIIEQITKTN